MRAALTNVLRATLLLMLAAAPLSAEVVRIEVQSRADVLAGQAFGAAGAYEKLAGTIYFAVDPTLRGEQDRHRHRQGAAKRRGQGRVLVRLLPDQAEADRDAATAPCSTKCRTAAARACSASSTTPPAASIPTPAAEIGDGFLMKQGFTLLWVGWQFDPPQRDGLVRVYAPIATEQRPADQRARPQRLRRHRDVKPITRSPIAITSPTRSLDPDDPGNVLTVRDSIEGARRIIPRERMAASARRWRQGGARRDARLPVASSSPARSTRSSTPRRIRRSSASARRRSATSISMLKYASAERAVDSGRRRSSARSPSASRRAAASCGRISTTASTRRAQPQGVRRRDGARRRRRPRQLQPPLRAAVARRPSVPQLLLPDRHLPVHRRARRRTRRPASPTAC